MICGRTGSAIEVRNSGSIDDPRCQGIQDFQAIVCQKSWGACVFRRMRVEVCVCVRETERETGSFKSQRMPLLGDTLSNQAGGG